MSSRVLDASALIAWLDRERGAERVNAALEAGAVISTVNLSEVVAKFADRNMATAEVRHIVQPAGLEVEPFSAEDALVAGRLRPPTRAAGLSLGDRACLALASRMGAPVLTADRAWAELDLDGVEVELVR